MNQIIAVAQRKRAIAPAARILLMRLDRCWASMRAVRSSDPGLCQSALSVLSPNLSDEHDSFSGRILQPSPAEGRFCSGRNSIRNRLPLQLRSLSPFCNLTTHAQGVRSKLDFSCEPEEWPHPAWDVRISPSRSSFCRGPCRNIQCGARNLRRHEE